MLSGKLITAAAAKKEPDVVLGSSIYGFGANSNGQLGLNDMTQRLTPILIGSSKWFRVAAGEAFVIVLKNDYSIWSCGWNSDGRTGLNNASGETLTLTRIGTDNNWAFITCGTAHVFGIKIDGSLWGWGDNASYQLGLVDNTDRYVPTQIGTDTDWTWVAGGVTHSLAIKSNGTLWSTGINTTGQTGHNTTAGNTTVFTQVGVATDWLRCYAGGGFSIVIKKNGSLWAFGNNALGRTGRGTTSGSTNIPTQVGVATDWFKVSCGVAHSLAITTDNKLYTWGNNASGRTGLNTVTGSTNAPTQIGVATDWLNIATGTTHSLAIKTTGALWSFGSNSSGGTGLNTAVGDALIPTQVGSATTWENVSGGNASSYALTTASSVYHATSFTAANSQTMTRAGLNGVLNGPTGILSMWLRLTTLPSNTCGIIKTSDDGSRARFAYAPGTNKFLLTLRNAEGSPVDANIQAEFVMAPVTNTWYHFLWSWDTSANAGSRVVKCYVNGVKQVIAFVNDTGEVPLNAAYENPWIIANWLAYFNGSISELYFAPNQYLDLDVIPNREKFVTSAGKPANLGFNGSNPTGIAPALYLRSSFDSFGVNAGTGGNFAIVNGPLTKQPILPSF